jgi:hypothetical protein
MAQLLFTVEKGDYVDVECRLPGASIKKVEVGNSDDFDLTLTTAFVHPGGPVEVTCRTTSLTRDDVLIQTPTLLLTEVASVN